MKKGLLLIISGAVLLALNGEQSVQAATTSKKSANVNVLVAFNPRNGKGMDSYINETTTPGAQNYRNYLTPQEVAQKYGLSSDKLASFQKYFAKYHLKTTPYRGHLVMKVSGSHKNLLAAFKAKPSSKTKSNYTTSTTLPSNLKKNVMAVVGLQTSQGKKAKKDSKSTKKTSKTTKKSSKLTKKIVSHAIVGDKTNKINTISPNQFAKSYGSYKFASRYSLDDLYKQNLDGSGQHIGLMLTGDFNKSDVANYLQKSGLSNNVSRIHKQYTIDESAKQQASSDYPYRFEATLDVEQASSVAPGADIEGYVGFSRGNKTAPDAVIQLTYSKMISDNNVNQISTSSDYGNEVTGLNSGSSESPKQYNKVYDLLFKQANLQGITLFSASGDNGAYEKAMKATNLPISNSQYLTMVGGTTLPYSRVMNNKLVQVTKERSWGDTYTSKKKTGIFPGSGGGFSRLEATPSYQLGVPGVNTFEAIKLLTYKNGKYTINNKPTYYKGKATGRNVPDVSGNADDKTGYAVYISYKGKGGKSTKMWVLGGGTSFVAPQMAAATAVMNSGIGKSVGFLNPQMYRLATGKQSPFTPLNDVKNNNNLLYTGQPNTVYNQATGLGTVNFAKLYEQLK